MIPRKLIHLSGTYANLPGTGIQGQEYNCTDYPYTYKHNGTIWVPHAGSTPLIAPPTASWTNVDTSGKTGTHASYGHGLIISGTDFASAAEDHRFQYRTAPLVDWTLVVRLVPFANPVANSSCYIGFRQSSDGKITLWSFYSTSAAVERIQIRHVNASGTGATPTFSGATAPTDIAWPGGHASGGAIWLAIRDDLTTNRYYGWAPDGNASNVQWFATETRTTTMTADQVLIGAGLAASIGGTGVVKAAFDSFTGVA